MMSIPTLQDLCCQFVCENLKQYPSTTLDEVNYPCLFKLVNNFSMYDLLMREQYLEGKGFNALSLLNEVQSKGFAFREAYPIRSIVCPHLLDMYPGDGIKWTLSKLFWHNVIMKAVETFMVQRGKEHVSLTNLQNDTFVVRFFLSVSQLKKYTSTLNKAQLSHDVLLELCILAAKKIRQLRVNEDLCNFLTDDAFQSVFHSLCHSLTDLSLIIMGNVPHILDFLKLLKSRAKHLSRICAWALTGTDLEYFDDVLSLCSGVITLRDSKQESVEIDSVLRSPILSPLYFEDEVESTNETKLPSKNEEHLNNSSKLQEGSKSQTSEGFDLMDDALLFGSIDSKLKFQSFDGMPRADIKISNLPHEKYIHLLDHHFTSWLSLTQLHLRVPELHPKIVSSLCLLLSRLSFKSMILSSAEFSYSMMDDLLSCIALKRKSCPLDKLMLSNLQEKIPSIQDTLTTNHLEGMNENEITAFVRQYESQRIAKEKIFQGTKVFEMFDCSMRVQTECLAMQYVLADTAIRQLCLFDSFSTLFMRATVKSLSNLDRQLTQLILQDWSMSNQEDCDALVCLLHSVSGTLEALSLAGCLRTHSAFSLKSLVEAIFSCKNLKSLDLSDGNIGDIVMQFVHQVVYAQNLQELCLRKISCRKTVMEDILSVLASCCEDSKPQLSIIDLRENLSGHRVIEHVFEEELLRKVAKRVLYDRWFACDDS